MKFAIISDIHGNYPALQLAIDDALKHGAQEFLFVGDYCVSTPWPKEVVETLMNMSNTRIIKGNEENYLRVPEGDDGQFEISRWCKHRLTEKQKEWLWNLPERAEFQCKGVNVYMTHSSDVFIGTAEHNDFATAKTAVRYPEGTISRGKLLKDVHDVLCSNETFIKALEILPGGIYIFGHTHAQWHLQTEKHLFINPGSCGIPLDCSGFGASYTLLTIEEGNILIEECRVKYDPLMLIKQVKATTQYEEAYVWSELIFREWLDGREKVFFFLKFVEEYAQSIGDARRPFAKDTWLGAFERWKGSQL